MVNPIIPQIHNRRSTMRRIGIVSDSVSNSSASSRDMPMLSVTFG